MTEHPQSLADVVHLTADLVAAYVEHNSVRAEDLPGLIGSVHSALSGLNGAEPEPEAALTPPVSIKKSITPEHLISLEDGKRYKSLKRHLSGRGLTPEQYRTKWSLPSSYPMVAPNYSKQRSELAKSLGLGRQQAKAAPEPAVAAPKTRGRKKKLAA